MHLLDANISPILWRPMLIFKMSRDVVGSKYRAEDVLCTEGIWNAFSKKKKREKEFKYGITFVIFKRKVKQPENPKDLLCIFTLASEGHRRFAPVREMVI